MKRISILAVLLVLTIASTSISYAAGNQGRTFAGTGIVQGLGLTDSQKASIGVKEKEMEKDILPLRQSIQALRSEINNELSSDNPDNKKINRLIDEISAKITEVQKRKITYMLWVKQQLTQEQRQKLTEFLKKQDEVK